MKTVLVILLAFLLVGCAGLPSVKNCKTVKYERNGVDVKIEAICTVPMGGLPGL